MLQNALRYALAVFVSCLLILADCRYNRYSYGAADKETQEKLDILLNEMARLKKENSAIPKSCLKSDAPETQVSAYIIPILVKREATSTELIYTVRYKLNTDVPPVVTWYRHDAGEYKDNVTDTQIYDEDDYVRETVAVFDVYYSEDVIVKLAKADFGELFLGLDNSYNYGSSPNKTEVDLPDPSLTFKPSGDIVYTPGHDVMIKVFSLRADAETVSRKTFNVNGHFYNGMSMNVKNEIGIGKKGNFVNDLKTVDFIDTQEKNILLRTSSRSEMGLLVFQNTIHTRGRSRFFEWVNVTSYKILRPSTQATPFPKGYIGIFPNNPNGTVNLCNFGRDDKCLIKCSGYGNNITDFLIYRIDEGGNKSEIPHEVSHVYLNYSVESLADVLGASTLQNAQQVTYECEAKDSAGNTASAYHVVNFFRSLTFQYNSSGIRYIDNTTAVVTCGALVDPPTGVNIVFSGDFENQYNVYLENTSVEEIPGGLIATTVIDLNEHPEDLKRVSCNGLQELEDGSAMFDTIWVFPPERSEE
ncbi:uncharacterized protein LOC101846978 [Aplysia californica]|uniref:Uncharacterized protein LOC101846978 n=1 Tax=Aplysia californica TaxID=6500 RepID=A0ABM0JZ43_APLCA|nr:uncharacterized protein LOC101846978 [Aplysia californica]